MSPGGPLRAGGVEAAGLAPHRVVAVRTRCSPSARQPRTHIYIHCRFIFLCRPVEPPDRANGVEWPVWSRIARARCGPDAGPPPRRRATPILVTPGPPEERARVIAGQALALALAAARCTPGLRRCPPAAPRPFPIRVKAGLLNIYVPISHTLISFYLTVTPSSGAPLSSAGW